MTTKNLKSISKIYEEEAHFWKAQRDKSPFSEIKYMRMLLEHLPHDGSILDIGCGTGKPIAHFFIEKSYKVTGIDVAKAMIEIASKNFPEQEWLIADMRKLDIAKRFHAIIAWDSFFHLNFEEQRNMFAIFTKHLETAGVLLFSSGPEHGEAIGDMNGQALYHSSLSPEEYRELFKAHQLTEIHHQAEDPECGGHTVWLCKYSPQ